MSKFIKHVWLGKKIVITLFLVGILTGFIYASNFFKDRGYYELRYKYIEEVDINLDDIISKENIAKTKALTQSQYTGSFLSTYQYVSISKDEISIEGGDYYTIKVRKECFFDNRISNPETTAKGFLKHLAIGAFDETVYVKYASDDYINASGKSIKGISLIYDKSFNDAIDVTKDNHKRNMIIVFSIVGGASFLVLGIAFVGLIGFKFQKETDEEIDNEVLFRTPFHKKYFLCIKEDNKSVKRLTTLAILISMMLAVKFIPIPSGFGNLGLSFGFLFFAIIAMAYGPSSALIAGFISDTLGYVLQPNGAFFFGYTLNAMLAGLAYAVLFYRTKITFLKVLLARVFVNLFVNALLGGIWWGMISDFTFEQTKTYMLSTSFPKNILYLLPQSVLLFAVIWAVRRPCEQMGIITEEAANAVSLF